METILAGFLGAGLAAMVFLAGAIWEKRRSGEKTAVQQEPAETRLGREKAGQAEPRTDARAEELRRKQWQEWLNFLYYDGSPSDG